MKLSAVPLDTYFVIDNDPQVNFKGKRGAYLCPPRGGTSEYADLGDPEAKVLSENQAYREIEKVIKEKK